MVLTSDFTEADEARVLTWDCNCCLFFRLKPSKNLTVLTSDFTEADEARVLTWGNIRPCR
jgi:hypothetical protein